MKNYTNCSKYEGCKEDILTYINERKKKAILNWVSGCLDEMVNNKKISSNQIGKIISDIENNPP